VVFRQPGAPLLPRSNIDRDEGCRHTTYIRAPRELVYTLGGFGRAYT
jgi:hypothetical protein